MTQETLLIVDDNHVLREGLHDIFSFEGYNVLTAGNGREALDHMKSVRPDLILSDISMPVMDGYSLFERVRSQLEWITIPFIFLTAHDDQTEILNGKNLGVEDYLTKPLTGEEVIAAVRSRLERSQELNTAQLQIAYKNSLTAMASAIDSPNGNGKNHVQRVAAYAHAIATQLGWRGRALEQLHFAAILHDIGKIMIPEKILHKKGPLSPEEWLEIKKHPFTGAEMIRDIPFLAPTIPIIYYHHERWEGGGYPANLAEDDIPQGARIVALAESFDSMTIDQAYQPRRTLKSAYGEVQRCRGTQFDPMIVDAFQEAWESGAVHQIRENNPYG